MANNEDNDVIFVGSSRSNRTYLRQDNVPFVGIIVISDDSVSDGNRTNIPRQQDASESGPAVNADLPSHEVIGERADDTTEEIVNNPSGENLLHSTQTSTLAIR